MASENRLLPDSHITRMIALDAAVTKNTATGGTMLTPATIARLTVITGQYRLAYDAVGPAKHNLGLATIQKTLHFDVLGKCCSHFIQVLNFEIDEGNLTTADLDWYKLTQSGGELPPMGTEAALLQVAKDLMKGESDRVIAGGTALIYPIARVTTAFGNYDPALIAQSQAADALDLAQEALEALNEEADKVIKKVWDEIETFYNEEAPPSQRANARQWGVVYVLKGSNKTVRGVVKNININAPILGAKVYFINGNKSALSNAQGIFELTTTLMGDQELLAEHNLYINYSITLTLVENENLEGVEINMTPA